VEAWLRRDLDRFTQVTFFRRLLTPTCISERDLLEILEIMAFEAQTDARLQSFEFLTIIGAPRPLARYRCTQVETLGIARSLGWKVHMRCAYGQRDSMKRVRECVYRKHLDIDTLVCTRFRSDGWNRG
jgi:hypothetical protein